MPLYGLNENHERGLLANVRYAAQLIRDCEEILVASEGVQVLSRYRGGLTPPQRKIARDYLRRMQEHLLGALDALGVAPPPASIDAVWGLSTTMGFLENTFEVAVVGRVSSGKSSLLNALIGSTVLPTGVVPVTAFPTRLRRGAPPALRVTYAKGRADTCSVDRIGEFVTEAHNPGNEKRLARLLLDHPSDRLPEGVTFVDTPGLGSVASTGALQRSRISLDATMPRFCSTRPRRS